LAEAFRADEVLAERLAEVDRELAELGEGYRRATLPGRVDVDCLIEFHRQDTLLRAARQEQLRQRNLLSAEIERRRQALVTADGDVRALEKLRERQHVREAAAALVGETKMLDEFAIAASARQSDATRREAAWDG
jgi:flagellar export protein FliJ